MVASWRFQHEHSLRGCHNTQDCWQFCSLASCFKLTEKQTLPPHGTATRSHSQNNAACAVQTYMLKHIYGTATHSHSQKQCSLCSINVHAKTASPVNSPATAVQRCQYLLGLCNAASVDVQPLPALEAAYSRTKGGPIKVILNDLKTVRIMPLKPYKSTTVS